MKGLCALGALIFLLVAPAGAVQLVTNGDFEADLSVGWESVLPDSGHLLVRDATLDPDPDQELLARKGDGTGTLRLLQRFPLPTLDLDFSVNGRMHAEAPSINWSAAAVILTYFDEFGLPLGHTMIGAFTRYCPWENSSTAHVVEVPDSVWYVTTFNLADEIATYLTGVDPSAVRQIEIAVHCEVYHC